MSYKMHILVCGGTGCRASASKNIICRLEDCLRERALEDEVQVIATGCFGFCEKGPIVKIRKTLKNVSVVTVTAL